MASFENKALTRTKFVQVTRMKAGQDGLTHVTRMKAGQDGLMHVTRMKAGQDGLTATA